MALIDTLVEFVCDTAYKDIPEPTVTFTKQLLSKIVAAMLNGTKTGAGRRTMEYVKTMKGPGEVGVVGGGFRCSLDEAVLINGMTAHAAELEDDQFPSATSDITVFPVILPLAEKLQLTGKDVIESSALGLEIMNRIGMFPLSSKGITDLPFYGVIGAAITAGKALKLKPDQVKNAVGISMGKASGFIVNFGSDAHYIESAGACRDGLMAAQMAGKGMSGNPDLEKWLSDLHRGLSINTSEITRGLGDSPWRVHEIWVKKYPCCFLTHRHIDMMSSILTDPEFSCANIHKVEIDVGPVDYTCNRPEPKDSEDARFSFQHIMAALMLDGDIDSHHFSEDKLTDKKFEVARKKVSVINHPDWPPEFMSGVANIKVTLNNGKSIERECAQAVGGPDNPLNEKQFADLYRKYTKGILNAGDADRSWGIISKLEKYEDLSGFLNEINFC
jgi:2-methylcitrate dehydratase PrpD